jgi:hypothetical protein
LGWKDHVNLAFLDHPLQESLKIPLLSFRSIVVTLKGKSDVRQALTSGKYATNQQPQNALVLNEMMPVVGFQQLHQPTSDELWYPKFSPTKGRKDRLHSFRIIWQVQGSGIGTTESVCSCVVFPIQADKLVMHNQICIAASLEVLDLGSVLKEDVIWETCSVEWEAGFTYTNPISTRAFTA